MAYCGPGFSSDRFTVLGLVRSPFYECQTLQVSYIQSAHCSLVPTAKRPQAQGRFVPDPTMSTVRTSRGDIIYPDQGSVMLVQRTSVYPARFVNDAATFSAASHWDLDSLYCTYCNKRRHEIVSCHKKWKDEKKALKHLGAQPWNNWGWSSC